MNKHTGIDRFFRLETDENIYPERLSLINVSDYQIERNLPNKSYLPKELPKGITLWELQHLRSRYAVQVPDVPEDQPRITFEELTKVNGLRDEHTDETAEFSDRILIRDPELLRLFWKPSPATFIMEATLAEGQSQIVASGTYIFNGLERVVFGRNDGVELRGPGRFAVYQCTVDQQPDIDQQIADLAALRNPAVE